MSANELWAILRDESQTKLLREDAKIPRELKVKNSIRTLCSSWKKHNFGQLLFGVLCVFFFA